MLITQNKNNRIRKRSPMMIALLVLLIVYAVSMIAPLLWALMSTLRTADDFGNNVFGFPKPFTVENYIISYYYFFVEVTNEAGRKYVLFPAMVGNTLLYSVGCAFMSTAIPFIMAYLVGRFKCLASKAIMNTVLVCLAIPIVGSLPSELAMAHRLGIHDTFIGIFIMRANFLGMYFLVFVAAVKAINPAFAESAKLDGANNVQILLRIYIPMLMGTIFTVFLIKFISFWNEYQIPMLYLPSKPTLSYGLNRITVSSTIQEMAWEVRKLAACMLVFIPIFILFIAFSNRIIGNVSMGGVKE